MVTGRMPRRFWVYTAGKDDPRAEEREARREQVLRWMRDNVPGLLAFSVIVLLTLFTLLLMLAEFRGYFIDQLMYILTPR
ncbi:MAG: hypothetical protein KatS3mg131_2178 [Candidatus Tectimicrobiota bacterium]|nr:MAG: hypothetical protein KatS3mg131_2178 [Candidatus Tectomicrobia bacterium]